MPNNQTARRSERPENLVDLRGSCIGRLGAGRNDLPCRACNGATFWSSEHCNQRHALIDRMEHVAPGRDDDERFDRIGAKPPRCPDVYSMYSQELQTLLKRRDLRRGRTQASQFPLDKRWLSLAEGKALLASARKDLVVEKSLSIAAVLIHVARPGPRASSS
ncbi:hypothetical protein QTI66_31300 [Variovorax sp. J22R133]|uniref:hypothetical protein n=1 Tax=Variovorax brevis TaxID=3053503 RepID=UPI00257712C1|nr:hypothetical protein [Variovorax sp. J22R133]MDM0116629.1 hypothetical protein [Variovorax sp. J22R133]